MTSDSILKNSNNKAVQINCERYFTLDINGKLFNYIILAGEDGAIKILEGGLDQTSAHNEIQLPYATDGNGWLIEIDDAYMLDKHILIVSPAGVIAVYASSGDIMTDNWSYKVLLESDECFYEIKEARIDGPLLYMKLSTEYNGIVVYTFDISD